jgi:hypothetical protein
MVLGLIKRAGAFYTVGSEKIQGKEKLYSLLRENDKLRSDLEHQIQNKIKQIRI